MVTDNIEKVGKSIDGVKDAIEQANASLLGLSQSLLTDGKGGFDAITDAATDTFKITEKLSKSIGSLTSAIPGLNLVGGAFDSIGSIVGEFGKGLDSAIGIYTGLIKTMDSLSDTHRVLDRDLFNIATQFGGTLDEAQAFTDYMLKSGKELSGQDFGHINFVELNNAVKALGDSRISLEKMNEAINSSAGSIDLLTTSVLHSTSLGVSVQEYSNLVSHAMLRQGQTAQEAVEQMAMFGETSANTGLTSRTVADTLQGLSNGFRNMGINASFGRPILEGFTNTLSSMGLGIENATELTNELGTAFANLGTNYSAAYLTAQMGGLDMGGGGALGAGISMQAKMLDPNVDQATLGRDIAGAIRDTLSGLTGGQIVTVQQAAESPELQNTFYAQTQILQKMYGISEQGSIRTLELLTNLEDATKSGDADLSQQLGEQLSKTIGLRQETLSADQKLQALGAGQLAELKAQTRAISELSAIMGLTMAEQAGMTLEEVMSNISPYIASANADASAIIESLNTTEQVDLAAVVKEISSTFREDHGSEFDARLSKMGGRGRGGISDMTDGLLEYLSAGNSLSVSDPALRETVANLASKVGGLVDELKRTKIVNPAPGTPVGM